MEQGNSVLYHEISFSNRDEGFQAELPPGFRFHPTDEELISHYLSKKVMDSNFDPKAIGVVDLNKSEPWELPKRAKLGEKEWYFFCLRDRKYPTGLRTNRATDSGYWKATGKDKEIYRGKLLIGLKKTLVFYRGRAPRGEKSNWVMHEFRMEGKFPPHSFPGSTKNDWVICRVFKKSLIGNGKKAFGQPSPNLPPLMDIQSHVTCFSNTMDGPKAQDPELLRFFNPTFQPSPDISSLFFSKFGQNSASFYAGGFTSLLEGSKMAERDISQETGLTSDLNQEISSGNEIGRSNFEECVWNC